jgi:hypothetical protein
VVGTLELTADEWEWFKHLARPKPHNRAPPKHIEQRLLALNLLEAKPGGVLMPTAHGRVVLKLVDGGTPPRWQS